MDNTKNCYSSASPSGDSSSSASSSSSIMTTKTNDHFLRHLNTFSHKISKPTSTSSTISTTQFIRRPPPELPLHHHHHRPPPLPLPPLQHQPPVYNINKTDFRDVVQKLTGSPAHPAAPPHVPPPRAPATSRLHRIRPPPLAQLANRPPPMLNCARPLGTAPLSPLPPFPSCHGAAESPISAYMRFLHNSVRPDQEFCSYQKFNNHDNNSIGPDQEFNNHDNTNNSVGSDQEFNNQDNNNKSVGPGQEFNNQDNNKSVGPGQEFNNQDNNNNNNNNNKNSVGSDQKFNNHQSSLGPVADLLLPFGCLMSPKSPCQLLSSNLMFSPTGSGQLGFPVSPTVSGGGSPKWRSL